MVILLDKRHFSVSRSSRRYTGPWRGHRPSYSCALCGVTLCVRAYAGLHRSSSSVWHKFQSTAYRKYAFSISCFEENIGEEDNQDSYDIDDVRAPRTKHRSRKVSTALHSRLVAVRTARAGSFSMKPRECQYHCCS